jgi:hypothetical protein
MEFVMKDNYIPSLNIQSWHALYQLEWLYEQAKNMDSIVEVGVWKGQSTIPLVEGCSGIVHCVDHFKGNSDEIGTGEPHFEATYNDISNEFLNNLVNYPNMILYKMTSLQATTFFKPNSIDMVYLDAGHLYDEVKSDILGWLPIAKKLICGHDYEFKGVTDAVYDVFGNNHMIKIFKKHIWYVELMK